MNNTVTQNRIEELTTAIDSVSTSNVEGRSVVIEACKELYNLIEQDVHSAGKDWMLKGIYTDLCTGNFSEPFLCNLKKNDFKTVAHIYKTRVVPFL